jgi:hypothetical protein
MGIDVRATCPSRPPPPLADRTGPTLATVPRLVAEAREAFREVYPGGEW